MSNPSDPQSWAALLKKNWNQRGQSPSRDFYVASHVGWQDKQVWENQAAVDTKLILSELDADWLARAEVLEVGCGVGRLVPHLLAATASYTGLDIAASMVAEARSRCREESRARFFESDGTGIPAEAKDRNYDLAIVLAVFIHCPKQVIELMLQSLLAVLAPGGRVRFQLLGDPEDPTGIEVAPPVQASTPESTPAEEPRVQEPPPVVETTATERNEVIEKSATATDMELIEDHYYMGHNFGYEEAEQLLDGIGGEFQLRRFDPLHIYGELSKPGP